MFHGDRPPWTLGLFASVVLVIIFGTIHIADEIARGEAYTAPGEVLTLPPIILLYIFGAVLAAKGNPIGFWIVLVLSSLGFFVVFVAHALGLLGLPTLRDIARDSGAVYAWALLLQGTAGFAAVVLSAWGLWDRRRAE
jgi:hypothetical protein